MDLTLPPPTEPDAHGDAPTGDVDVRRLVAPDGMVGGVAAHIARLFGVDALWVRIAFVLLTLAGGIGLLLYAGLWLSLVVAPTMGWPVVGWIGGVTVVVGIPWMLVVTDVQPVSGGVAVVILLAGLALALWQPRRDVTPVAAGGGFERRSRPTRLEPESAAFPEPGPRSDLEIDASRGTSSVIGPNRERSVRPRREPSLLGRATLGLAIVVAAVGALIDDGNGGRLHPEQWLGAAALVCGIGLVVGAIAGRARWLVLPAIVFAGAGFGSGELARRGIGLGDAVGDDWVYVSEGSPDTQRVETGVGDVYVQLDTESGLDHEFTVDARAAVGTVYVNAGSLDTEVVVRARTDRGHTELDGQTVGDVVTLNPGASGGGRLVVDAWVGIGDVVVYQAYAGDLDQQYVVASTVPVIGVTDVDDGTLTQVDPYLAATHDGWIVILNGEAVIDPDDQVVAGQTYRPDGFDTGPFDDGSIDTVPFGGSADAGLAGDGTLRIETSIGEFRLLPRSLLITPDGRVVDLQAIRASVATQTLTVPATSPAPSSAVTTVVPPVATLPPTVVSSPAPPNPTPAIDGGQP